MIYITRSTSSFTWDFSNYSDISNFYFSAALDNSDVFSLLSLLLHYVFPNYIILGDLNLHHPICGRAQATADPVAENYIIIFKANFLHYLKAKGSLMCSENCYETTIDLVFASPPLKDPLESCTVGKDLNQRSDHLSILFLFHSLLQLCLLEPHWQWKNAHEEVI